MPTTLPATAPPQIMPWPPGWRRYACLVLALIALACALAMERLCRT